LILFERAKVILTQKVKILREDLEKQHDTIRANKTKSGSLKVDNMKFEEKEILYKDSNPKTSEKESTTSNNSNIDNKSEYSKNRFSINTEEEIVNTKERNELVDINSDVEHSTFKGQFSDGTSMSSSYSSVSNFDFTSPKSVDRMTYTNTLSNFSGRGSNEVIRHERANSVGMTSNSTNKNKQGNYRDFVKLFLKTKFEKLDVDHSGQKINQNTIWDEVVKHNIPRESWKEFILNELKNFKKYNIEKKNMRRWT